MIPVVMYGGKMHKTLGRNYSVFCQRLLMVRGTSKGHSGHSWALGKESLSLTEEGKSQFSGILSSGLKDIITSSLANSEDS